MEDFQNWRATVVAQVRFKPDRAAIQQELTAHYEDHVRDLERLKYPTELAEKRAVEAMGDPEEIGRALDRVHKPWLGWLWKVSRILLVVLATTAVCAAWFLDGAVAVYQRIQAENGWEDPPFLSSHVELPYGDLWAAPGEIRVENGRYTAEVRIWLELDSPKEDPEGFLYALAVTGDGEPLPQWDGGEWEQNRWRLSWETDGWTRHQCMVILELDHRPERAEITYPYGNHDWTLRVEWGETP